MEQVERLAGQLERLSSHLRRAAHAKHCDLDVTPGQMRVLRVLSRAEGGYRIKDLAACLCIVPRSATSAVDDLEDHGYVERVPDPDDRRAIRVRLTDDGHALVTMARQQKSDATALMLGALTSEEQEQLSVLLDRLVPAYPADSSDRAHPHGGAEGDGRSCCSDAQPPSSTR